MESVRDCKCNNFVINTQYLLILSRGEVKGGMLAVKVIYVIFVIMFLKHQSIGY